MMKGLDLDLRWGKGEHVVSSLLFGGKPSRPIGNTVETQAEGRGREEGREGLLGMDSDVLGSGAGWPWDVHFTKCPCNSPFPFISAGALLCWELAWQSENKCSVRVRQSTAWGLSRPPK